MKTKAPWVIGDGSEWTISKKWETNSSIVNDIMIISDTTNLTLNNDSINWTSLSPILGWAHSVPLGTRHQWAWQSKSMPQDHSYIHNQLSSLSSSYEQPKGLPLDWMCHKMGIKETGNINSDGNWYKGCLIRLCQPQPLSCPQCKNLGSHLDLLLQWIAGYYP